MHIPCIKYNEHALKCSCEKDPVVVYQHFSSLVTLLDLQNGGLGVDQKTAILKRSKGYSS